MGDSIRDKNWRTRHIDGLIGKRIEPLRSERGFSRADLARALRMSQPAIQHIEEGDNRVSASQLWQICGVLGVDAQQVFGGMPNRIWRDRDEYEAWRRDAADPVSPSPPGVGEASADFEPAPAAKDILRLVRAAKELGADQIDTLVTVARGLKR